MVASSAPRGATFQVDAASDSHDAAPGDGVAGDHLDPDSSSCTLRAAIEEANALTGPDTVLVPAGIGPIRLTLGSLRVQDNGTVISGLSGRPVIDGVGNPVNHASFLLESDSNAVSRLELRRSRGDAITVLGSANQIGSTVAGEGLVVVGSGLDSPTAAAIRLTGPGATANSVAGNYIGIQSNGVTTEGNAHGVVVSHQASLNMIGGLVSAARNIISGNSGFAIIVSDGAFKNQVAGNYLGADSTGTNGPGNHLGGVVLRSGARENVIGGDILLQGNLISANHGHGVELTGMDVTANRVDGNMIGATADGRFPLGNHGDGILVTNGAHHNLIGGPNAESGNLLSGNDGSGVHLSGSGVTGQVITANWIGTSLTGYGYLGNGWLDGDGVLVDSGANANTIGGSLPANRNVISANYRYGVQLSGSGTSDNRVMGNYIGLNAGGTSSLGNAVGVGLNSGAEANIIGGPTRNEGNVISGNRSDDFPYGSGVLIFGDGTRFNQVAANLIGLDAEGAAARRNGSAGIIVGGGAQYNLIGGDNISDGNVISGNGLDDPIDGRAAGIHIFGATTCFNRVAGNLIGTDRASEVVIGNRGHGIGLYSGAHHNVIGGDTFRQSNEITGSEGAGIFLSGPQTRNNLLRRNFITDNDGLGIDLRDSAQAGIEPPRITTVGRLHTAGPRLVAGLDAPPGARIDIYNVDSPDPSGAGEGNLYLASTYANANGRFEFYLPAAPPVPIILTATATDAENNSSEFSVNGYSPDATGVEDTPGALPLEFSLAQNYPNPFNLETGIVFTLPHRVRATLTVYNVLGQRVRTLADQPYSPGEYEVVWNGRNDEGHEVASGMYLYRLEAADYLATRKMILIK